MNFIKLLFKLKLENEEFSKYSEADFIKLEKLIKVERQINSEISFDVANKLLGAVKKYSREIEEFVTKRSIINIFLNKPPIIKYDKLHITTNFNALFNDFLEDDLKHIIKRNVSKRNWVNLEYIMIFKPYFSDNFTDSIQNILETKLSYANSFLYQKGFIKHAEYDYLLNKDFFSFISHINNFTIEDYLESIYNNIIQGMNDDKPMKHELRSLIAFSHYNSNNIEFNKILKYNRSYAIDKLNSDSIGLSIAGILVVIFFMYKIFFSVNISNSNVNPEIINKLNNLYKYSFNDKERHLNNYIRIGNKCESKGVLVTNVKTGDNPFNIMLPIDYNTKKHQGFVLKNNSNHDLIIMEYERDEDNMLLNLEAAFFVKNTDTITLSNHGDKNTLFSFYIGDSLSNYKNYKRSVVKQLYKKDKKTPESRFKYTFKNTLGRYYKFENSILLTTNKNNMHIISKNMKQSYLEVNGLFKAKDTVEIELK